jgi:cell division protein FtsL
MDPWEENMVAGLRQQIKDLKAENEELKQELKKLSSHSKVAA